MYSDKLKTRTGEKSIVVVLGMHRSGTSAITRALQVLDIDLGERLMLPAENNNEKGFFEDIDVNAINIELLNELGKDWHTLSLIQADELLHEKYAGLRLRAAELLRSRLQNTDRFGLKDPRMCRLLPFWQKVFEHLQLDVSYVIAVRNPLSVAKSLEARNQLPHEKSHYLWLEHILPSVLLTRGARRVLVDYDLLLDNPQQQVARMALGLDSRPDPVSLAEFSRDFLDIRMRHSGYKPEDVFESPLVPNPVRTAVMLLADVAADRLSLDSEEVSRVLENLAEQMAGMSQAMNYLLRLDNIITGMSHVLNERNNSVDALSRGIAERDGRIETLAQTVRERNAQMATFTQDLAERDDRIEILVQTDEERKARMAALTQGIAERDDRIAALTQAARECEVRMVALNQGKAECDGQIKVLAQTAGEDKAQIAALVQGMRERDGRIAMLTQTAMEYETQMAALSQGVVERDVLVKELMQAVEEREGQITVLNKGMAERDNQIAALTKAAQEHEAQIVALSQGKAEYAGQIKALIQEAEERKVQMAAQTQGMAERDERIAALTQAEEERKAQMAALTEGMTERGGRIEALTQVAEGRKAQITALTQGVAERDVWIEELTQTLEERKAQTAALIQGMAERDNRIATLTQIAEERGAQMAGLTQGVAERDMWIEGLTQAGVKQDMVIQQLRASTIQHDYRLKQTHASLGWKLFKPVRMAKGLLPSLNRKFGIGLAPLDQLQCNGAEWLATGRDGQFLLMAERAWHGLAGWYWLDLDMAAEKALEAKLLFDNGEGFDSLRVINLRFSGKGPQRIPLFVPHRCRTIRLDLFDVPATFSLSALGLSKLAEAPELPAEFLAQSTVYEALGGREGNATALEPANSVQHHGEADFCWRSEGEDPWFVLQDISQKLRPGWYMIELRICSDAAHGNAKLYFDYGEGYSEWASVALPFRNGQESKRLCHLPSVPKQVRFDPLEGAARFSVERLHFSPVLPMFAYHRMLRRLRNHYEQYKGMPLWQIWRDLQAQEKTRKVAAKELLIQRYNHTFRVDSGQAGIGDGYEEWITRNEVPEFSRLDALAALPESFRLKPMVSVVMPVYNTAETFLRQAIESVLAQGYPHWELCIADDASTEPHVRAVLEEYMRRDSRIKVAFREENGHISAASNSALALATGEYVALLDHDDELVRHALHLVVEAINQNPSAQVLYSDEDKIDEQGNRADPHFKPDWNPDLFFSQNYVSHLGVYRRELLQRAGGFRTGVEGSQDQDLLLRCLPHVNPAEIVHIPKVLYHWRIVQGSTALACGEKSYTTEAGIKVLHDFFSAQGREDVKVENGLVPNTYRVRYPVPQPEPLVSLLIPTRDKLELLEPCIRSTLDKTTYRNYEIIILDNESAEPATLEFFKHIQAVDSRVRVLPYHQPFNYSALNNYGVQQARGELIGLVNNDIEVISPEWLTEMVSHALRPEIGCVGAKLYYEDETIQHAGVIVGLGGVAGHSHKYFPRQSSGYFHRLKIVQNLSAVTAACLLVRKSVYEQVGGLEENGLRIAFNDVDFCLKVREAGYRNLWTPYAELFHYESKSRGAEDTREKVERFNKEIEFVKTKWGELLRRDPCYSPNLTLAREDFSLEGA